MPHVEVNKNIIIVQEACFNHGPIEAFDTICKLIYLKEAHQILIEYGRELVKD